MKRGLVDLSSVIWTHLLYGKDKEYFKKVINDKGKEVIVNSASYGYENSINFLLQAMTDLELVPRDLIFVMEGKNSKHERQMIHPGYKAGRDKLEEQYLQFNICKEMLMQTFLNLGAQVVWQDGGVEADDVLGYLAQQLEGERWIISGDKDMAVMVGGDIHHYRAGKYDENPFGEFPFELIPVYIALVGDSGDGIPGARGFGPTKWNDLYAIFGDDGLRAMEQLIKTKSLLDLQDDVPELKDLQKIIDDAENVYMSYALGKLMLKKVNTMRRPLQWRVGMVKPRALIEDERLRKWGGVNKLIPAEHFAEAYKWAAKEIAASPYVTLDVESSTPDESDEWLALQNKDDGKVVDVFGSELTSLQMSFGPNLQYTVYLPVDNVEEAGVSNLTIEQVASFVDLVPREKITYVHNAGFELPVCYMAWGELWKDDPDYHGFLRNVRDTAIASSYVDENRSRGLKGLSKDLLGYEQTSYEQVTTREYLKSEWNGKGKLLGEWLEQIPHPTGTFGKVLKGTGEYNWADGVDHYGDPVKTRVDEIMVEVDGEEIIEYTDGPAMVKVQHKMNELTAKQVLSYGADDCICTAAVANHFRCVMQIEKTEYAYEEVETYPAYLTALSFVQGKPFSLEDMVKMEEEDAVAYDEAALILRAYLMKIGYEGTKFEPITEITAATIKLAFKAITGEELKTQVRTPSKLAILIEPTHELLAWAIREGALVNINKMMEEKFTGNPKLDLASPKQMKELLYDHIKMPIRVINDVTPLERVHARDLDEAVRKFKQFRAGKSGVVMTDEDMALLRKKAKTDDTAIDMALAFDMDKLGDEVKGALKAIGVMKKVMTRRSLFYKNWRYARHWKDNRVHSSVNQCAAVTRRYSMSNPNDQQLPKKGKAVKFRGCYKPHKKNAIVSSIDYIGQELRLAAEVSQDKNMLACYIGDKLKDIHSITAAGAMNLKWGKAKVSALFEQYGADLSQTADGTYDLFLRLRAVGKEAEIGKTADDLRKDSKNVNFGAQNGARAAKLSETLIMPFADAQLFLDAREAMFPDVGVAAERAAEEAKRLGYVTTLMGARRHLAAAMLSSERGAADRAARQAWNFQIQGSAGEMTKLGMARMWKTGLFFRYDAQFYMPVHDELVSSVVADQAVDFLREKHACMAQPYATMKVPVLGSISIGPDFAQQFECGDEFIEANIRKYLAEIFKAKETV